MSRDDRTAALAVGALLLWWFWKRPAGATGTRLTWFNPQSQQWEPLPEGGAGHGDPGPSPEELNDEWWRWYTGQGSYYT